MARTALGPSLAFTVSRLADVDTDLLVASLSDKATPNFMSDPVIAAQVIAKMCAPNRANRYATLPEALEDLAICES